MLSTTTVGIFLVRVCVSLFYQQKKQNKIRFQNYETTVIVFESTNNAEPQKEQIPDNARINMKNQI